MTSAGAILFDFDGTLVEARQAAWELFQLTNERFALGIDRREDFFEVFEGNLFDSLERSCADPAQAEAAKEHFFGLMRTDYHPHLIPGMVDVVRALAPTFTLAVLSSNMMGAIRRILEEAGIAMCFSHVFAGDVERSKAEAIRRFLADRSYASLRQCSPSYDGNDASDLVTDDVYLVTDTIGDIAEAGRCGIHAIGVAWGMHEPADLAAAGAERVALWPQELTAWFGGDLVACERCRAGLSCSCAPIEPAATLDASCSRRLERRVSSRQHANHALTRPATTPTGLVERGGADTARSDLRKALRRTMRPGPVTATHHTTTTTDTIT